MCAQKRRLLGMKRFIQQHRAEKEGNRVYESNTDFRGSWKSRRTTRDKIDGWRRSRKGLCEERDAVLRKKGGVGR